MPPAQRDPLARAHAEWIGNIQPVEGLVVSVPALVEAQVALEHDPALRERLARQLDPLEGGERAIRDLPAFLADILGLGPERWRPADSWRLAVADTGQILEATSALARQSGEILALLWDIPAALALDRAETVTGGWSYPPAAKFERLLRHAGVPIGILTNRTDVRLVYAPAGGSTGSMTWRMADLETSDGRRLLAAFVALLGAPRWFSVAAGQQLPALLHRSREVQAQVTGELAEQVFEALEILLRGFEAAADRDGRERLEAAYRESDLYGGILTFMLRLVFCLYAEDQGLLPVDDPLYARHLSILGLYDELAADQGSYPDAMPRRFGAYGRLVALFRAIFLGAEHGSLSMPARRGQLFSPHEYPFLEGWSGPSAPIVDAVARAQVRVPTIDDGTIYQVLHRLLFLDEQRLSYRALDVEQIGSVYEALMGYRVEQLAASAVCLRETKVWLDGEAILDEAPGARGKWLQDKAGLAKAQADRIAKAVAGAKTPAAVLEALEPFARKGIPRAEAGRFVIQPGAERRRSGSHYTPRSLTAPIVAKTLEPLLAAMGPEPSSERLLSLTICDPAMGSGAFLVEACRQLAERVVEAWRREGEASGTEDALAIARRLVAQKCLYGVDKNPMAVNLAKLSLWLVTLAKDKPFTFLDHALRHGDSLVGLDLEQIASFHWKPGPQVELTRVELKGVLDEAVAARQRILDMAGDDTLAGHREKVRLLGDAADALEQVRLIGDLVVGAFFSSTKDKEREAERKRRLEMVTEWLRSDGPPPEELREMQAELRARIPAFHWPVELPEVFWDERPDPLAAGEKGGKAWIDAFMGNPPFLGGRKISGDYGEDYSEWLLQIHGGSQAADYSAQFFRRTARLIGDHGTLGLLATNTICEGDTRATGLQPLVRGGLVIYAAIRSMPWPGESAVAVSVLHLAKGRCVDACNARRLDGRSAAAINSRLREGTERSDPVRLAINDGKSYQGSVVLGLGFVLTPQERRTLVARNSRNLESIFPYLGGEEVNTSPTHQFERYVINFGEMSLAEAKRWPDLMEILTERVKPERKDEKWWLFWRSRPELYAALRPIKRCLVNSRHSKHLAFAWQPTNRVFSDALYVYPLVEDRYFATLQSRIHEPWARLLSSTMEDRLRYAASDCFDTFPFPREPTLTTLDPIGKLLYDTRARYMVDTNQGLTATYNQLKDPDCTEPRVLELRRLHEELDRQVLAAYGWSDLAVPPYCPLTDDDRARLAAFEDAVIDRLFALNAERAAEEAAAKPPPPPKKTTRKKAA